jgi:two-component system phosphate regulon response regulator PhoB
MSEHALQILVVEDEADLRELVQYALTQAGYRVVTAPDAATAFERMQEHTPALVLLDLMLPDLPGTEVCRRMRREPATQHVPIVMMTARGDEIDRVVGFELGADDYVVKPFSPRELALRVGAVLRRSVPPAAAPSQSAVDAPRQDRTGVARAASSMFVLGPLQVDIERHEVTVLGQEVVLTAIEFKLLVDLIERRGRVQSREALLERVWGYASGVETRTVDTHVKRLREKLGEGRDVIETVRGVGYRIRD